MLSASCTISRVPRTFLHYVNGASMRESEREREREEKERGQGIEEASFPRPRYFTQLNQRIRAPSVVAFGGRGLIITS